MIVLAWILFTTTGPTWPAYPDYKDCVEASKQYGGSHCEQKKIFVIQPTVTFPKESK